MKTVLYIHVPHERLPVFTFLPEQYDDSADFDYLATVNEAIRTRSPHFLGGEHHADSGELRERNSVKPCDDI